MVKEKWYISRKPGYSISLPEGMIYKEVIGGVTREKRVVTFRARGGKMVKSTDKEIQNFLENCLAFKRHHIMRVKTPAEIAEDEKRKKQEAALGVYKGVVDKGVPIDFDGMSDSNIRAVADEIGAETSTDGKKLSKASIVGNVKQLVYGKEVETEKMDLGDPA